MPHFFGLFRGNLPFHFDRKHHYIILRFVLYLDNTDIFDYNASLEAVEVANYVFAQFL